MLESGWMKVFTLRKHTVSGDSNTARNESLSTSTLYNFSLSLLSIFKIFKFKAKSGA